MTALALIAAKGSPGVTTLASAMVLAHAQHGAVLIEADAAGGDLALHHGVSHYPGLADLAARAKHATPGGDLLAPYIRALIGGALPAVIAPVDGQAVRAALNVLADRADLLAADHARMLVFDLGRTEPDSPGWMWLAACDRVLLVSRTDLTGLAHAAQLAEKLRDSVPAVALALIDSGPYPPAEAEQSLGLPLAGLLPWSPKQAAALTDHAAIHTAPGSRLA
ncbi:MAG: MinD/ParA family ATP-binding protein, partial [Sciscionella sp.]